MSPCLQTVSKGLILSWGPPHKRRTGGSHPQALVSMGFLVCVRTTAFADFHFEGNERQTRELAPLSSFLFPVPRASSKTVLFWSQKTESTVSGPSSPLTATLTGWIWGRHGAQGLKCEYWQDRGTAPCVCHLRAFLIFYSRSFAAVWKRISRRAGMKQI